jgi:outer membrane protein TolC
LGVATLGWPAAHGVAQQSLTLQQAIDLALHSNPVIEAAEAGKNEADAGIRQARAGYFPNLRFSETWQRSNNPVFVFGSLLNQRQFSERNFAIDLLNNPDPVNNFQSRFSVEQVIFDSQRTKRAVQAARLASGIASEQQRSNEADVILGVVRTYLGAVLAAETLRVAEESVKTAEADLARAQTMLDAGMTTEADVLSARVQFSSVEQERIRAEQDVQVGLAALNDALGVPLDNRYNLATALSESKLALQGVDDYERQAAAGHPELRQAELSHHLAGAQVDLAKSNLWPRLVAHGILEADRQKFASQGGGNWLAGVSLEWDIWKGSENRARLSAARFAEARAEALGRSASSGVRLQIRRTHAALESAAKRVDVASQAVVAAEESHRIIQNRYDAGLTTVTELIRSQTALMATKTQHLGALYEKRVAAAALDHAAGSLTASAASVQ